MENTNTEKFNLVLNEEVYPKETHTQGTAIQRVELPELAHDNSVDAMDFYKYMNSYPNLGKLDFYVFNTGDVYLCNSEGQVYRNGGKDVRLRGLNVPYQPETTEYTKVYPEGYDYLAYPAYYLTADSLLSHYKEEQAPALEDEDDNSFLAGVSFVLALLTSMLGVLYMLGRIPNKQVGFIGLILLSLGTGIASYSTSVSNKVKATALVFWALAYPTTLYILTNGA